MTNFVNMNEWTFSGQVFYIKELTGEMSYSLKIKGNCQRINTETSQIVEITCLIPQTMTDKKAENIKLYTNITVSGHIETWQKMAKNGVINTKQMLIVDYIF